MAFIITDRNKSLSSQIGINPQSILQIEGLDTVFGSQPVLEFVRWDAEIFWDSGVNWDGYVEKGESLSVIDLKGSTKNVTQQIFPDKSSSGSISSVNIRLIDIDSKVAKLLSFDNIQEIIGKKCDYYIGFKQGAFPEDAIPVFRGVCTDFYTENGAVVITVAHPDAFKRQNIYEQYLTQLTADILSTDTVLPVSGTETLLLDQDVLETYLTINEEIVRVISKTDTTITVVRGQFDTIPDDYEADDDITSLYKISGNPIDLSLKLLLSEEGNEFFLSDDKPKAIENNNELVFDYYDIQDLTGLVIGDLVRLTGANAGDYAIIGFEVNENDSRIILNATLVNDSDFTDTFSYKSKYNVLPDGLGMLPFNVDVAGHEDIFNFNPAFFTDYTFYLKETIEEAKSFIEEQIYFPQGLYSIPRKARSSCKLVLPPLTSEVLPTINTSNITNIGKIRQRRSAHKYLYNIYRFDYELDQLEDKYKRKEILINNDSKARIKIGNKQLQIQSQGLRDNPQTTNVLQNIIQRYKDRFSFAPTYFDKVRIQYSAGFNIEVGDVLPFGGEDTQIVNLQTGERNQPLELYEVINKSLNIKDGTIEIDLLQTSFNINSRYAVFSLASKITSATTVNLTIDRILDTGEFLNESDKWQDFEGRQIRVRSDDYTYDETTILIGVNPQNINQLLIEDLPSAPPVNSIVEIPLYQNADQNVNDIYKIQFSHMTFQAQINSVTSDSVFDVSDVSGLFAGSRVVVSSPDYVRDSFGETFIIDDITGTTITLDKDLPFTPVIGDKIENSNFGDGGFPYQLL